MKSIPDKDQRLQTLLFYYRNTAHSSTGQSPAESFLQRRLDTVFDRLKPDRLRTYDLKSFQQKYYHDSRAVSREFNVDDKVWYKRGKAREWNKGRIAEKVGPLSYRVQLEEDESRVIRCHADHLKKLY